MVRKQNIYRCFSERILKNKKYTIKKENHPVNSTIPERDLANIKQKNVKKKCNIS